jgi:hypothetical protein
MNSFFRIIQKLLSGFKTKKNKTGLPNSLKSGIENLSGDSMDDLKVHYNSDKPAQFTGHAYAQGTDIHLAFDMLEDEDAPKKLKKASA